MANVTDKDLEAQRARVDKLRDQLAAEQSKATEGQTDLHNEVELTQLQAEEARLQTELAAAKEATKKGALRDGAAVPLAQAKEQMEAAVARQKAQEQAAKDEADKQAAEEKALAEAEKQAAQAGTEK